MSEDDGSSYNARQVRKATLIREESRAYLASQGVTEGEPIMAEKPTGGPPILRPTEGLIRTNMFAVKFVKDTRVFRYDLTVTGYIGDRAQYDYTRRAGSDVAIVDRKEKCRAAFDILVRHNPEVMPPRQDCVYDLQAIVFTFKEINFSGQERLILRVELDQDELGLIDSRGRPMFAQSTAIVYLIKPVRNFNLVLTNETIQRSLNINLEEQSSDLQQFVEILTSQHAFADGNEHVTFQGGRSYLLDPAAHGFVPNDFPDLTRGAYLAIGTQKSCKIVEGPSSNNPRLTVIVENKKTPFHAATSVADKIFTALPNFNPNRDLESIRRLLKDLWVTPTYSPAQSDFKICDIQGSARETTFQIEGQPTTVEEYYLNQYQIRLEQPLWPLLVSKGRDGQPNYYPIESCFICDNQRLTSAQLTPDQTSTIIRTCARLPAEQVRQIQRNVEALKMNAEDSMVASGVAVASQPLQVQGSNVPHPRMQFQSGEGQFDPQRGEWRPPRDSRFLLPARIGTWALYVSADQRIFSQNQLQQFSATFVARCRQQGMIMEGPAEALYLDNLEHLRARFEKASESASVDLIMVITDRKDLEVHQVLKSLEQKHDIVTQNVTSKIALESITPQGGRLTLANVVNKTNMKCGGLNYAVYPHGYRSPLGDDDLFIGFGSNHPGSYSSESERKTGGAPTVIGYAANDLEHPCAFSGDYVYSESRRDEKVGVIDQIVKLCTMRYIRNRGKYPKRVLCFRNGCSEGQFASILRYEVPLIQKVLKELKVDAGITLIVPNRMHIVRLTPSDPRGNKAWEQNLPCGTAIDSVINHPVFFDFYLLSHIARQGTAKVPRYTVLHDSNKMGSDELILISYCLCFEHQIINGPTSFPTPVYIANRYAERGRMVYNVFQRTELVHQQELPGYEEYNERLTYYNRQIRDKRFNA